MAKRAQRKEKPLFKDKHWEACRKHFLASLQSTESQNHYRTTLARFFAFVGHKAPQQVVYADVVTFCGQLVLQRGEHIAPSPYTFNFRLDVLRSFYQFATQYEVILNGKRKPLMRELNPTKHIKQRKTRPPARDLTEAELRAFFAVIPRDTAIGMRNYAMFVVLFFTARRRAEGSGLLWGDLEQVVFLDDDKPRAGWRYTWKGKGHTAKDDWAEMPEPAMDAIKEYLMYVGKWGKMQPNEPLFPGIGGKFKVGQPLNRDYVSGIFRRYANLAGLHKGACTHSLRWEGAFRRWEENGHNMEEISELLRHSNLGITQGYFKRRKSGIAPDRTAQKLATRFKF